MLAWFRRLFASSPSRSAGAAQIQGWESELVRRAVEHRFTKEHHGSVLAELARMRAEWLAAMGPARTDVEELVRLVVRTQLDVIEASAGDPAFLTEEHYQQSAGGLTDRDRLCVLDQVVKYQQLMDKDVLSLVKMLDYDTTRQDALSALERIGDKAVMAVPRIVKLLREGDQQECCKALRTLAQIGPAARGAASAVMELANDPDYLISQQARVALRTIAPDRVAHCGFDK
jgi:hypothetical protein